MEKFYLHFSSVANSPHARRPAFRIQIECTDIKDATLIGNRMCGEPSWEFSHAEQVKPTGEAG